MGSFLKNTAERVENVFKKKPVPEAELKVPAEIRHEKITPWIWWGQNLPNLTRQFFPCCCKESPCVEGKECKNRDGRIALCYVDTSQPTAVYLPHESTSAISNILEKNGSWKCFFEMGLQSKHFVKSESDDNNNNDLSNSTPLVIDLFVHPDEPRASFSLESKLSSETHTEIDQIYLYGALHTHASAIKLTNIENEASSKQISAKHYFMIAYSKSC